MATTYTTFLDSVKLKKEWILAPNHKLVRIPVNFATQGLDVSASDVHQVITVPAESLVKAWPIVKTAGTANAVVDLGYGSDVDLWGNAIAIDNTGTNVVLLGSATWNAGSLESGETAANDITVDGAAIGDHVTATMGVDVVDLAISAQVTAANMVTVTLSNTNDTIIDGSATWDIGSLDPGETAAKEITVTGAALGDYVLVSHGVDVSDVVITAQVTATNTVTVTATNNSNTTITASDTWDPGSLDSGETIAKDVTVTGAAVGDYVEASFNNDVVDMVLAAQVTATDTVTVTLSNNNDTVIDGSATWDVGSLDPGETEAKEITVTGAAVGDYVIASHGVDVTDLLITAQVTATNTVTVTATNISGTVITASTTWDAASLDPGETEAKEVTVTGAALGDYVDVALGVDVADLLVSAQVTADNTVTVTLTNASDTIYSTSATWDVGDLGAGAQESKDFTVTGAALGDYVIVAPGVDVTDMLVSGVVTATNTVTVTVDNETAGNVNLAESTWKVYVIHAGTAVDLASTTVYVKVTHQGSAIDLGSTTTKVRVIHPATAVDLASGTVRAKVTHQGSAIDLASATTKVRVIHPATAKDLASTTVQVEVNKAPYAGQWKYFSSADTINLTGTSNVSDTDPASGVLEVWAEIISLTGTF